MGIYFEKREREREREKELVVGEIPIQVHSLDGGATEGVPKPQENAHVWEPPLM